MSDILQRIVAVKREELAQARTQCSLEALRERAQAQSPARGFAAALRARTAAGQAAVIDILLEVGVDAGQSCRVETKIGWVGGLLHG